MPGRVGSLGEVVANGIGIGMALGLIGLTGLLGKSLFASADIPRLEGHFDHAAAVLRTDQASWAGRVVVREPGAIYGRCNGLEPEFDLTGTRRVRPVEPLSPGFDRRHRHAGTGGHGAVG